MDAEPAAHRGRLENGLNGVVKHLKSWWFWTSIGVLLIIFIALISRQVDLQWFWLVLYAAITVPFAPYVANPSRFFRGGLVDTRTDLRALFMLAASVSISWVFAKSILNASLLGGSYGIVGAVAYMAYYTSFASVAFVVYFLRTRKGYRSLPEAIHDRYGTLAVISFGLAVAFRLYQEVWSNAIVIAGFFGAEHSKEWWLGATMSTLIPVVYAFTGGMRASLVTDAGQMVTCVGLLVAVLILLGINAPRSFGTWNANGTCALPDQSTLTYDQCAAVGQGVGNLTKAAFTYTNATCNYTTIASQAVCEAPNVGGTWTPTDCAVETQPLCQAAGGNWDKSTQWSLKGGVDLLIVGLLQGLLSYPFFDPVLTDRAFLAEPKTMVKAFTLGGIVAGLFIFFFGFLGIFGSMVAVLQPWRVEDSIFAGFAAGQPSDVARFFGTAVFSIVNLIFITQSLSTLDSTFTSAAKLMGPEFTGLVEDGVPRPPNKATHRHLAFGRIVIIVLPIVGMLPLLASPTALDATTTSGTVIMGLGPAIYALLILPRTSYNPLLFHLPFWWGVTVAIVFQLSSADCCKDSINMTGWYMGGGPYKELLGVNVIGTAVAWALAAVCLLENPLGSGLVRDASAGNNFVQTFKRASRQMWRRRRQQRAVQGELPVSHSNTSTSLDSTDIEKDTSDGTSDETTAKPVAMTADEAAHQL